MVYEVQKITSKKNKREIIREYEIGLSELLIKNGADINIKDNDGKKPFDYGSKEIIKYFQLDNQK